METGKFPFNGRNDQQIILQIMNGQLKYHNRMDDQIVKLVQRMTKINPNDRPSIDEILEDSFFEDVGRNTEQKKVENVTEFSESGVEIEMQVDIW
jgi:serine/threonine protein kinase